ncbi:hypothetical protein [Methanoregula sp.]|jgi:hypothetical protein|uniref:hypothetical protein n=1 Tax=Methanoregula sp. TaxID=2052170 RepID=UPI0025E81F02|nr:hypothetical protein [Methanoregula sp.]
MSRREYDLMGRSTRDRAGNRGGKRFGGQNGRGTYDDPWDEENPDQDPCRNVRDLYEEPPDSPGDEYVWPENEEEED